MSQNNALLYKNLCFCLLDLSQRLITAAQVHSCTENHSTFSQLQIKNEHTHKKGFPQSPRHAFEGSIFTFRYAKRKQSISSY